MLNVSPYRTLWHLVSEGGEALHTPPARTPESKHDLEALVASAGAAWAETEDANTVDALLSSLVREDPRHRSAYPNGRRLLQVVLLDGDVDWFLIEPW